MENQSVNLVEYVLQAQNGDVSSYEINKLSAHKVKDLCELQRVKEGGGTPRIPEKKLKTHSHRPLNVTPVISQ